jgi:hypothetical protein
VTTFVLVGVVILVCGAIMLVAALASFSALQRDQEDQARDWRRRHRG